LLFFVGFLAMTEFPSGLLAARNRADAAVAGRAKAPGRGSTVWNAGDYASLARRAEAVDFRASSR
jgi:hypothetical protein